MELDRLYALLKEQPRDARWLLRKVGTDYMEQVAALRAQGQREQPATGAPTPLIVFVHVVDDTRPRCSFKGLSRKAGPAR